MGADYLGGPTGGALVVKYRVEDEDGEYVKKEVLHIDVPPGGRIDRAERFEGSVRER